MRLSTYLTGIILFGVFVIGMWGMAGSMATSYGVSTTEELERLSHVAEVQANIEEAQPIYNNPFKQVPYLREVYSLTFAGSQAIKTILDTVDIAFNMIATIGGLLPIPDFILAGLKALFILGFLFSVLNLIFGGGRA